MEVHPHGHVHEEKKWKEYVFQFIMLFLAVFLGFLTENFRLQSEEKKREKDYIGSLIVDLAIDHASISIVKDKLSDQIRAFDSLQTMFNTVDLKYNAQAIYNCYYYSSYLQISFPVNFNERTITQLLSSGNMRLLKTRAAADSVTDYFNLVKDAEAQKQMYVDHVDKCMESMYDIYDINYLRRRVTDRDSLIFVNSDWSNLQLLSTDPVEIKKLIARLEETKLIIQGYKLYLNIIDARCLQLGDFLSKEYHLKNT